MNSELTQFTLKYPMFFRLSGIKLHCLFSSQAFLSGFQSEGGVGDKLFPDQLFAFFRGLK